MRQVHVPAGEEEQVATGVVRYRRFRRTEAKLMELGALELTGLELEPWQNNVQIDYFAVDFGPGDVRYRHRLTEPGGWSEHYRGGEVVET